MKTAWRTRWRLTKAIWRGRAVAYRVEFRGGFNNGVQLVECQLHGAFPEDVDPKYEGVAPWSEESAAIYREAKRRQSPGGAV